MQYRSALRLPQAIDVAIRRTFGALHQEHAHPAPGSQVQRETCSESDSSARMKVQIASVISVMPRLNMAMPCAM